MPLIHFIESYLKDPLNIPKNIIWRFPKTISNKRHIFVVGAPRSGSTFLKALICGHPNLKGVTYETTGFFNYVNLFSKNRYKLIEEQDNFPLKKIEDILSNSQDIIDCFDNFTSDFLALHGKNRFVEKVNSLTCNRIKFLTLFFPQAYFINIVRDGRDCYCSALNHDYVHQSNSISSFAQYWKNCVESTLNLKHQAKIYHVRYEDLTSYPEEEIKKIFDFIEETYYPDLVKVENYNNKFLSQSVYHKNIAKEINISSQKRWEKQLSLEDIHRFQNIAQQTLKYFKYQII